MDTTKQKRHVVAFDFEAAGGIPALHGFTQLGAVLYCIDDDQVIDSFNAYARMDGFGWERRCLDEFWLKNAEHYEQTLALTSAAPNGPFEVVEWFIEWLQRCTEDLEDVYLITDNAAFDAAILRHFARRDILYLFGEYRSIVDVSCVYQGMSQRPIDVQMLDAGSKKLGLQGANRKRAVFNELALEALPVFTDVSHDHHPVNDATVMAKYWGFFMRELAWTERGYPKVGESTDV